MELQEIKVDQMHQKRGWFPNNTLKDTWRRVLARRKMSTERPGGIPLEKLFHWVERSNVPDKNWSVQTAVVAHAFDPSTQEAEAGGSL